MEGWIRPLRSDRLSAAGGSYGGKQGGGRDTAAAKKMGPKQQPSLWLAFCNVIQTIAWSTMAMSQGYFGVGWFRSHSHKRQALQAK